MGSSGHDPWPDPLDGSPAPPPPVDEVPTATPVDEGRRLRATEMVAVATVIAVVVRIGLGIVFLRGNDVDTGGVTYFLSSSVFFIAVPAVLAWLLLRRAPASDAMGRVMTGTTVGLLFAAMVLGEGALCVAFAAPLVYLVAAVVVWARRGFRSGGSLAIVVLMTPLLGDPVPTDVLTTRTSLVVNASPAEMADAIARGPDLATAHRSTLLTLGFPVPDVATRSTHGDATVWSFDHSAGTTAFRLDRVGDTWHFTPVTDTATSQWFRWTDATLAMSPVGDAVRLDLELRFDPSLGPDWWFGTIEARFLQAAGDFLLDGLAQQVGP